MTTPFILVRFGELSTKNKNRMVFVHQLSLNIKDALGEAPLLVTRDRILVRFSAANMQKLKKVFGIYSFSPVMRLTADPAAITAAVIGIIQTAATPAATFRIIVRRADKGFPHGSMAFAAQLGEAVIAATHLRVDLAHPHILVEVEIRPEAVYLYTARELGLGGYPVGVNGKVLLLLSGGIDSPVAAFELMKRGLRVDFLNFVTPPSTDAATDAKVVALVAALNQYQGAARLFRSDFADLMQLINLVSLQSYKIILMRRSFYRIASALAEARGYLAVANGETVGQVASQTLESLRVIDAAASTLVLRPLVTFDKIETIALGKRIGTYEISILPASEACELFTPPRPVIKPKPYIVDALELELSLLPALEAENLAHKITERHI